MIRERIQGERTRGTFNATYGFSDARALSTLTVALTRSPPRESPPSPPLLSDFIRSASGRRPLRAAGCTPTWHASHLTATWCSPTMCYDVYVRLSQAIDCSADSKHWGDMHVMKTRGPNTW